MAHLLRVKVRWSGFIGSPGYSVMHFLSGAEALAPDAEAQAACMLTNTWASQVAQLLPAVGSLQVVSDVEEISESTGEMVNVYNGGNFAAQMSTAPAGEAYSGPVGAVVNWRTSGIRNGRRVHGKTFLVPLRSTAFEANGTLSPTTQATIQSASNTLVNGAFDAPDFGVYCRPTTKGNTDGIFFSATSAGVPDLAAVLRSRRD